MTPRRRIILAVTGMAGAAVVAVVVVFALGVRGVPSFPTLDEQPEPRLEGTIAYSTYDDDQGRCIWVQALGTAPRRFMCEFEADPADGYIQWFGFDDSGQFVVARQGWGSQRSSTLVTYDPVTFDELASRPLGYDEQPPQHTTRADGARVDVRRIAAGEWAVEIVAGGTRETVVTLRGPESYFVSDARWSDDGRWIVVMDSGGGSGRSLVIAAEGSPDPRVLAEGSELAWDQPGVEP